MNWTPNPQPVEPQRKLGQGSLGAAFRQGFSELAHYLKAFPDSAPIIEQPGQLNNVPPSGVSQQAGFTQPVSYQVPAIQEVERMASDQKDTLAIQQREQEISK